MAVLYLLWEALYIYVLGCPGFNTRWGCGQFWNGPINIWGPKKHFVGHRAPHTKMSAQNLDNFMRKTFLRVFITSVFSGLFFFVYNLSTEFQIRRYPVIILYDRFICRPTRKYWIRAKREADKNSQI